MKVFGLCGSAHRGGSLCALDVMNCFFLFLNQDVPRWHQFPGEGKADAEGPGTMTRPEENMALQLKKCITGR